MLRAGAKVANGADNVADATKAVNAADNAVTAAKNTSKLQESAKIGQEAHRQIEADLKHADSRIRTEVTIKLDKKKTVRKDILKPTGTVGIIKPDTPSGHKSAERRVRLMNRCGYKTETFYYDPSDSRWLPNSSSYIGPKK